jgi:hypothetical protein
MESHVVSTSVLLNYWKMKENNRGLLQKQYDLLRSKAGLSNARRQLVEESGCHSDSLHPHILHN